MIRTVRRHGCVSLPRHLQLIVFGGTRRDPLPDQSIPVEIGPNCDKSANKIRTLHGYVEPNDPTVARADDVGLASRDALQEFNRVVCHVLIAQGPFNIRRTTSTALLGSKNLELLSEWRDL